MADAALLRASLEGMLFGLVALAGTYLLARRLRRPPPKSMAAYHHREVELRARVSNDQVQGWVNALRLRDETFDLDSLLTRARWLFEQVNDAWIRRDLSKIRAFVSDATYQTLKTRLSLWQLQGLHPVRAQLELTGAALVGLHQSQWFDCVQILFEATACAHDASNADAQAIREPLAEVWTFIRKPGARSRSGELKFDTVCPNCNAPYKGGATNVCEYCQAVVNSGNYDWTLSEISAGTEHVRHHSVVDGLLNARKTDPALNVEVLEDRSALIFWKWIEAQTLELPARMAKVARGTLTDELGQELERLSSRGKRKVMLECSVRSVFLRELRERPGFDEAVADVRWTARIGIGPRGEAPPDIPAMNHRTIFLLTRRRGATTPIGNGLSTSRCLKCNGPLTDSLDVKCEYCGAVLSDGAMDWVAHKIVPYPEWHSRESDQLVSAKARERLGVELRDPQEISDREPLLLMMASIASAGGAPSGSELGLLRLCAERWSVPWNQVEVALGSGAQLFESLIPVSSPDGAELLRHLLNLATLDGRLGAPRRRLLELAAKRLGVTAELRGLLG